MLPRARRLPSTRGRMTAPMPPREVWRFDAAPYSRQRPSRTGHCYNPATAFLRRQQDYKERLTVGTRITLSGWAAKDPQRARLQRRHHHVSLRSALFDESADVVGRDCGNGFVDQAFPLSASVQCCDPKETT